MRFIAYPQELMTAQEKYIMQLEQDLIYSSDSFIPEYLRKPARLASQENLNAG